MKQKFITTTTITTKASRPKVESLCQTTKITLQKQKTKKNFKANYSQKPHHEK